MKMRGILSRQEQRISDDTKAIKSFYEIICEIKEKLMEGMWIYFRNIDKTFFDAIMLLDDSYNWIIQIRDI